MGVGRVGEMDSEAEIISVGLVGNTDSCVNVAPGVSVGASVENTAGDMVDVPASAMVATVGVWSACAVEAATLIKGVGDSFAEGRIVVSMDGRCPQAIRKRTIPKAMQRVGENMRRANDIAEKDREWNSNKSERV